MDDDLEFSSKPAVSTNQLIYRKLKELSKYHIQQVVSDLCASLDRKRWEPLLLKFVMQAVDQVKPSSRYLRDSMDFNKYVSIQLIDYFDESKSTLVNGSVFMKNLAFQGMPRQIENPRILLLRGSLGFLRDLEEYQEEQQASQAKGSIYIDISNVINQEEHYVNILVEKIKQVRPNVIVTEKDISFKILKVLKNMGMAAIANMHIDKMKRLARLTKTIIAPSANVLDYTFQTGVCKMFRVEEPVAKMSLGLFNNPSNDFFS
jgi:1-phosphatidylinositol-3-phosphate 5-kinase